MTVGLLCCQLGPIDELTTHVGLHPHPVVGVMRDASSEVEVKGNGERWAWANKVDFLGRTTGPSQSWGDSWVEKQGRGVLVLLSTRLSPRD